MAEKAIVCVRDGEEYGVYLKDRDGGPVGLGTELIEALRKVDAGQALQAVGAASLGQWVRHPEDAFPYARRDIGWIYVIHLPAARVGGNALADAGRILAAVADALPGRNIGQ